jgi:rare lipoprotein A
LRPDECGLASVYSSQSEETASGEDTGARNLTAAHRSLPFETIILVENQATGRSAVVRITDRGPFVGRRIFDVSQAAAHEFGFANLTKVCLKILSIPRKPPAEENLIVTIDALFARAPHFDAVPTAPDRSETWV